MSMQRRDVWPCTRAPLTGDPSCPPSAFRITGLTNILLKYWSYKTAKFATCKRGTSTPRFWLALHTRARGGDQRIS